MADNAQAPDNGQGLGNDPNPGKPMKQGIPEKFKGKSLDEVMEAYVNLESHAGKLASEKDHVTKEKDEWVSKYSRLESERQQTYSTQQPQAPAEMDPITYLDEHFEEDPKKAIREAIKRQRDEAKKETQAMLRQTQASQASEYYYSQKKENPDFSRREPVMQQLVKEYADIIHPDMLNSPKVLKALDLMSRGQDVGYYEQEAVKRAQKNSSSAQDEKRRSQSESSNTEGDRSVDFGSLSLAEQRKLLGVSDD
jgi:hypothetical protein